MLIVPTDLKTMHFIPAPQHAAPDESGLALRRVTALALLTTAVALSAVATVVGWWAAFSLWYAPKALAVFALCALCVWRGLHAHAPHGRFGAANGITLVRLAMVTLLAAAIGERNTDQPELGWAAVVLATTAAVLDAADGPIARRRQQASAFGARFDMETDAFLILVLSVLVLQGGKAGAWIVAAGAMRYAFVLAARPWPWLAAPLPPSLRRKSVCVVQIVALIACLGPVIQPPWSTLIAAFALAALTWSFLADILWLSRRRGA